jgi:Asp-tRNA(Asn)/Glu-tRNA(Gln) amidotransferase A subunit family amidase
MRATWTGCHVERPAGVFTPRLSSTWAMPASVTTPDRRISSITGARRAVPHDHTEMSARRLDVDGRSQPYTNNNIWAAPATGAGLPATMAPIGRTETGLPIGVQIIGPYLEDSTPIQFAQLLEQAFGGFVPPVL